MSTAIYGSEDHVPSTYHALYMIGWKPDPNNPETKLKPGSTPKGISVKM